MSSHPSACRFCGSRPNGCSKCRGGDDVTRSMRSSKSAAGSVPAPYGASFGDQTYTGSTGASIARRDAALPPLPSQNSKPRTHSVPSNTRETRQTSTSGVNPKCPECKGKGKRRHHRPCGTYSKRANDASSTNHPTVWSSSDEADFDFINAQNAGLSIDKPRGATSGHPKLPSHNRSQVQPPRSALISAGPYTREGTASQRVPLSKFSFPPSSLSDDRHPSPRSASGSRDKQLITPAQSHGFSRLSTVNTGKDGYGFTKDHLRNMLRPQGPPVSTPSGPMSRPSRNNEIVYLPSQGASMTVSNNQSLHFDETYNSKRGSRSSYGLNSSNPQPLHAPGHGPEALSHPPAHMRYPTDRASINSDLSGLSDVDYPTAAYVPYERMPNTPAVNPFVEQSWHDFMPTNDRWGTISELPEPREASSRYGNPPPPPPPR